METAVNYIIESSLSLGLMALFYRTWLKRRPVMWFNRLYLLLALTVSAVVPLVHFSIGQPQVYGGNVLPEVQVNAGYYLLDTVTVWGSQTQATFVDKLQQLPWLKLIYLTGILMLAAKLLAGLIKIRWFKHKGVVQSDAGFVLVDTRTEHGPFSFFNILFINSGQYRSDEIKVIIDHELAHIRLKHTYDILLLELILIVQWFNPFAWLLRHDLKEIHEYQADQGTLQAGADPAHYRELLVLQALGTRIELGHNFSQSLIKKRLKMINSKNHKSPGFVKPAAALLLMGCMVTAFGYERNVVPPPPPSPQTVDAAPAPPAPDVQQPVQTPPPPPMAAPVTPPPPATDTTVYQKADVMPEFPGGQDALMKYLFANIKYPSQAIEKGVQGTVVVSFVVSAAGEVTKARIVKGIDMLNDESLRVTKGMPRWKPGTVGNKPVNVQYTLPIRFALSAPQSVKEGDTYTYVETMPQFQGGDAKLMEYLAKNCRYPAQAKDNNWTGKTLVSFVVMENGGVDSAIVLGGSGHDILDQEALRVIKSMPNWIPGKQNGQVVRVKMVMPVKFALDPDNNPKVEVNGDKAD